VRSMLVQWGFAQYVEKFQGKYENRHNNFVYCAFTLYSIIICEFYWAIGLGLAILAMCLKMLGYVWCFDQSRKVGITFTIFLVLLFQMRKLVKQHFTA
jgi:hypothetical protein